MGDDRAAADGADAGRGFSACDHPDWFESVYAQAKGNAAAVSWADLAPNPNLIRWLDRHEAARTCGRALVVGCGLGDDAEELARRGFETVAFDVSTSAIQWCQRRFPGSRVKYVVADLFQTPSNWKAAFDFVLEAYTLQVLPLESRPRAMQAISVFVATKGTLLVIARGREVDEPVEGMPRPLSRAELERFKICGLVERSFEDYMDDESPPVRRFMVTYQRG